MVTVRPARVMVASPPRVSARVQAAPGRSHQIRAFPAPRPRISGQVAAAYGTTDRFIGIVRTGTVLKIFDEQAVWMPKTNSLAGGCVPSLLCDLCAVADQSRDCVAQPEDEHRDVVSAACAARSSFLRSISRIGKGRRRQRARTSSHREPRRLCDHPSKV